MTGLTWGRAHTPGIPLYHRAVKVIKQEEDDNRKAKLAECISKNNDRNLWEELRKIKGKNKVGSPIIDDATYPEDITKIFSNKYRKLYSSAPTKVETLNDIRQKLAYRLKGEVWANHRVEISNTVEAIKKLNNNKNDGMLGTNSNHFIYGSEKLCGYLTCLLNIMFSHGHTAEDLLTSIIISIPKNYNASLKNSENYRGVALCVALSEIIDNIFITKYKAGLATKELQFAFKENHSTILCTAPWCARPRYMSPLVSLPLFCMGIV